jgi:hypothetical protein
MPSWISTFFKPQPLSEVGGMHPFFGMVQNRVASLRHDVHLDPADKMFPFASSSSS